MGEVKKRFRQNQARPIMIVYVLFQPHETSLLNVQDDLFGKGRGAMSRLGGISVEHDGTAGAVLARGFSQEVESGYSLAVQFNDPQGAKSSAYQGAGLRLGAAGGESLTPVVVAYNAGASDATVTGRLPYTLADGGTAEATLTEVRLSPGESREINVAGALSASGFPPGVSAAGLEFEYSSEPGSVQMTAFSVGAGGNQLFRVPMWDVQAQRSGTGGYPWRIEGNSSTYVYLKNATDRPQEYTFQLSFEGGFYVLGVKTIEPRQTIAMDVRALRDGQTPDVYGNTIPATADRGQVMWSLRGGDGLAMIGRSEQADLAKGVSSSYACQFCCPNSFYSARTGPASPASVGVGGTLQFTAYETDKNCYGNPMQEHPVNTTLTWFSGSGSAATIDSNGLATGVTAATSTGVYARWNVTNWTAYWQGCSSYTYQIASPSVTLNVVGVTFKKADHSVPPSTIRMGINSNTLAGTLQDRKQQLKAVVTPAARASSVTLVGDKVQISNTSVDTTSGVITFDAVGITASQQQGDGSIKAKIGTTVVGTQTATVVIPAKLTHDNGGSFTIQNVAMNSTTAPPNSLPASQFQLNTLYYKPFVVTIKDKWDNHVGDAYAGAEITEVFGTSPEASINVALSSSGTYTDPVGVVAPGITVASNDSRVTAWPSQPRIEALAPGGSFPQTHNITVRVAGFEITPPSPTISRSVTLDRSTGGTYTLTVIW